MIHTDRYQAALETIRPPGSGCHPNLLGVANRGVLAGITPEQIFSDIRHAIPAGDRHVPDSEITDPINKALADHNGGTFTPKPRPQPLVTNGKAALRGIIAQGTITDDVDLGECSPVRLLGAPEDDAVLVLETLYRHDDLLWIGGPKDLGFSGRPSARWPSGSPISAPAGGRSPT